MSQKRSQATIGSRTTNVEKVSTPWCSRLLDRAAQSSAKLLARLLLVRARRIVGALDHRQLADAGIDTSKVLPPHPSIPVDYRLMTQLMSMR